MGGCTIFNRGLAGFFEDTRGLCRIHDCLGIDGDVFEQLFQVHFLMILGADKFRINLACDGKNRGMVVTGIIKAVQKMDGTTTRRADTA